MRHRNLFRLGIAIFLMISCSLAGSHTYGHAYVFPSHTGALMIGDSISAGWSTSRQVDGFAFRVKKVLNDLRIQPVTQIRSGMTVEEYLNIYVTPADVDLVIIELGTNDIRKGRSLTSFSDDYNGLLRKISSPEMNHLFCIGVFEPRSPMQRSYDYIIENICTKYNGRFISISDIYEMQNSRGPVERASWNGNADLGHPNDQGHEVIAKRLLSRLGLYR